MKNMFLKRFLAMLMLSIFLVSCNASETKNQGNTETNENNTTSDKAKAVSEFDLIALKENPVEFSKVEEIGVKTKEVYIQGEKYETFGEAVAYGDSIYYTKYSTSEIEGNNSDKYYYSNSKIYKTAIEDTKEQEQIHNIERDGDFTRYITDLRLYKDKLYYVFSDDDFQIAEELDMSSSKNKIIFQEDEDILYISKKGDLIAWHRSDIEGKKIYIYDSNSDKYLDVLVEDSDLYNQAAPVGYKDNIFTFSKYENGYYFQGINLKNERNSLFKLKTDIEMGKFDVSDNYVLMEDMSGLSDGFYYYDIKNDTLSYVNLGEEWNIVIRNLKLIDDIAIISDNIQIRAYDLKNKTFTTLTDLEKNSFLEEDNLEYYVFNGDLQGDEKLTNVIVDERKPIMQVFIMELE